MKYTKPIAGEAALKQRYLAKLEKQVKNTKPIAGEAALKLSSHLIKLGAGAY